MDSIITFVRNEQRTFAELPLTPVDSLVFSSMSYFDFDKNQVLPVFTGAAPLGLNVRGREGVRVVDVLSLCDTKKICAGSWLEDADETLAFVDALRRSRRYRDVVAAFYVNEVAAAVDKQFSAATFFFEGSQAPAAYVAFRGTDGTLTGWKEDFNLSYKEVIPSQRAAAAYLSGVASATDRILVLGGHSKGGNLAQFAALSCPDSIFGRIAAVYDHDGPSFLSDPTPRRNTPAYLAKLHKTVPESSAFGMILERHDDYRVVQSSAFALFQHHPFSWVVDGDDFVYQEGINPSARFFDDALDGWLRSRTPEERERFIQTIYDLIIKTNASSWAEFQQNLASNLATVMGAHSKLDADTKKFLGSTVAGLGSTLRDQSIERIKESFKSGFKFE